MNALMENRTSSREQVANGELLMVVTDDEAAKHLKTVLDKEASAKIHDISAVRSLEKEKNTQNIEEVGEERNIQKKVSEAPLLEKSNLKSAALRGITLGFLAALATNIFLSNNQGFEHSLISFASICLFGLFMMAGAWISTLIGVSEPNDKLKDFAQYVDRGNVLLIVKAPRRLLSHVQTLSSHALGGKLIASTRRTRTES